MSERAKQTRTIDANAPVVSSPNGVDPTSIETQAPVAPLSEFTLSPVQDRNKLQLQFEELQARFARSGLSEALREFVEQQQVVLGFNTSQCLEQVAAARGDQFARLLGEVEPSPAEQRKILEIAAVRCAEEIRQARNGLRSGTVLPIRDPVLYAALDPSETLFAMRSEYALQQLGLPTSWAAGAAENVSDLLLGQQLGEVALGVESHAELLVALKLFQADLRRLNECARAENRPEFNLPELNACVDSIADTDQKWVEAGRMLVGELVGQSDQWLVERLQAGIHTEPIFS